MFKDWLLKGILPMLQNGEGVWPVMQLPIMQKLPKIGICGKKEKGEAVQVQLQEDTMQQQVLRLSGRRGQVWRGLHLHKL